MQRSVVVFPGTRLTEEHEEFLILDIKRDIVKCDKVAEAFCDVFEFYCRHKYFILLYCGYRFNIKLIAFRGNRNWFSVFGCW